MEPAEAPEEKKRDKWSNKAEFILCCVGLSVGLGNIWRFPYLAYENGGGAFLLPYILLLTVIGRPIYYMELILGQFSSFGTLKAFGCIPAARGVGLAMVYSVFFIGLYYNVILSYALTYLYYSFWKVLPWTHCDPAWADKNCYVRQEGVISCKLVNETLFNLYKNQNFTGMDAVPVNKGSVVVMVSNASYWEHVENCTNATETATQQFFYRKVLALSSGIDELGDIQPELAVSLFVAWFCVFLTISKGVQSSGKVVFVTALAPFFILGVLLVRSVSLEGASTGLKYYFLPDFEKILSFEVWQKAAEQVFFSLGIAQGMTFCMGSYNEFTNDLYRDVYIIACADLAVSLFGGVVVFSVLGNMAHNLGVAVPDVVSSGFGLAFVTYPQAVTLIAWSNVWAVAFFLMLFFLALGSEFAIVEAVVTPLKDQFEVLANNKTKVALVMCALLFVLGLPMTKQGGLYILHALDTHLGGELLRWIGFFESLLMATCYGVSRLTHDADFMMNHAPGSLVQFCWTFLSPGLLGVICFASLFSYKLMTLGNYNYPTWLHVTIISMTLFPISFIIWGIAYHFITCKFDCTLFVRPSPDWGPRDRVLREKYRMFLVERGIAPPGLEDNPSAVAAIKEAMKVTEVFGKEDIKPDEAAKKEEPNLPVNIDAVAGTPRGGPAVVG